MRCTMLCEAAVWQHETCAIICNHDGGIFVALAHDLAPP